MTRYEDIFSDLLPIAYIVFGASARASAISCERVVPACFDFYTNVPHTGHVDIYLLSSI